MRKPYVYTTTHLEYCKNCGAPKLLANKHNCNYCGTSYENLSSYNYEEFIKICKELPQWTKIKIIHYGCTPVLEEIVLFDCFINGVLYIRQLYSSVSEKCFSKYYVNFRILN